MRDCDTHLLGVLPPCSAIMSPRGQDGYSQVPSPPGTVNIYAEASQLLDPSEGENNNENCIDNSHSNLKRFDGNRHAVVCAGFCVLTLVVLLLVILTDGSPFQYISHLFRPDSSTGTGTCGLSSDLDAVLKLKPKSTLEGLKQGAVASDHPVCSDIGKSMLEFHGGNAVDAAVATALCLGVANPASSGIGGGMFMVIHADRKHHEKRWNVAATAHDATSANGSNASIRRPDFVDARNASSPGYADDEKITEVIDAREVAPDGAYRDMYLQPNVPPTASVKGGLAVAVLGELRGLELAHARHGSLDWSVVVEPALRLARDGVIVTNHLSIDIANQKNNIVKYGLTGLGKLLTRDGLSQTMLKEGDLLKNPTLAKTLEAVMEEGADAIYKGERARNLAADIQAAGGIVTEEDLNRYKATLRSPLISEASGFSIVGVPPPSSGGATIIGILRFLSGFSSPMASLADTLSIHRLVEGMRHAFAIRMSLSDPDFSTNVTLDATNDLVRGSYMEELRISYRDNGTANLSAFGGPKWAQLKDGEGAVDANDAHEGDRSRRLRYQKRHLYRTFGYLEDHGTTHLSVVDSQGNAVSLTSTINTYFGSGIVSQSTGIVLNNQMDDFGTPGQINYFGLKPSEANFIEPRKKPLSSMAPMLVFKKSEDEGNVSLGKLFLAIGASGGPKIITSVVQVFINHALLGMSLFDAMSHPRVHDQLLYHGSDVTCFESVDLDNAGPHIEVSNRTKEALINRDHQLLSIDYTGVVQAVSVDLETASMSAVSDIRKAGVPAGY